MMKVKQYHPDVNRGGGDFDFMIRRVIQAYEVKRKFCSILVRFFNSWNTILIFLL